MVRFRLLLLIITLRCQRIAKTVLFFIPAFCRMLRLLMADHSVFEM